jgi:hypothetical protein
MSEGEQGSHTVVADCRQRLDDCIREAGGFTRPVCATVERNKHAEIGADVDALIVIWIDNHAVRRNVRNCIHVAGCLRSVGESPGCAAVGALEDVTGARTLSVCTPLKFEIVAQTLFAFVGSYSTHEIVPLPLPRGVKVCTHVVANTLAAFAVRPIVVRRSCPEAAPLITMFELVGAIAIAVIEPPVCCALLVPRPVGCVVVGAPHEAAADPQTRRRRRIHSEDRDEWEGVAGDTRDN